jgi:hypothetical protein
LIVDMMKRFHRAPPVQQSAAVVAYRALGDTIIEIRDRQRTITQEIVDLEQSGAVPEAPILPDEFGGVDTALINGAAYAGAEMPAASQNNITLHRALRRKEQLATTLAEAERQMFAAQVDLSAELLAVYDDQIRSLHRRRALALLKVFACNRDIESLRVKILESGGIIGHSLDGHTARLGGTIDVPTKWNDAQRNYIDACIKMGVVNDEDLQT